MGCPRLYRFMYRFIDDRYFEPSPSWLEFLAMLAERSVDRAFRRIEAHPGESTINHHPPGVILMIFLHSEVRFFWTCDLLLGVILPQHWEFQCDLLQVNQICLLHLLGGNVVNTCSFWRLTWSSHIIWVVSKNIINNIPPMCWWFIHVYTNRLHPFMVILEVVYYCFTKITRKS